MGIFKKKDLRKEAKRKLRGMLGDNVEIGENSPYDGFYLSISSDCPTAHFHISANGVASEVDESKEPLVKRSASCKLLTAIIQKEK
jgi:hypothetical protein